MQIVAAPGGGPGTPLAQLASDDDGEAAGERIERLHALRPSGIRDIGLAETTLSFTLPAMLSTLGIVAITLAPFISLKPVFPNRAFDFSVREARPAQHGFIGRILNHVDGGDFHGYDHTDGTSHKANDFLRTKTVRAKFHF